jgi:PIN domain nuclease of toxin-antitoxin system
MKLLLDTHLLLWAAGRPERLPGAAHALLDNDEHTPMFSPASPPSNPSKRTRSVGH